MRKTLIGLAAAAIMLLAAGCGDDDDDTALGGGDGGGGLSEEFEARYMAGCTAGGTATEEQCQCSYDAITERFSADELLEYEQQLLEDPSTPPPDGFVEAITECTG